MNPITRSVFFKTAAAALAGKLVPNASATATPAPEKPLVVKMAELFASNGPSRESLGVAEIGMLVPLHGLYRKQPFPVPDWLAKNEFWAKLIDGDRRKAEGTHCSPGTAWGDSKCAACGDYIGRGKPLHYHNATEADETKIYHPECCPACIKAGRTPAAAARERKRQAHIRKGHYCASHESGSSGRCRGCGKFLGKNAPRHVDAYGGMFHPKCCLPCHWRPEGEPNELPA